jgi:hypothetical protein
LDRKPRRQHGKAVASNASGCSSTSLSSVFMVLRE